MSAGLECYIQERDDGFYYGIEKGVARHPLSDLTDDDFDEWGPFKTVADLKRDFQQHANPGGFSVELKTIDYDEFDRQWNAVPKRSPW